MSSTVNSIALSGIAAATAHLDTASHNIANAQTPQFRRQVVTQVEQPTGGVSATVQRLPASGAELSTDIITQLSASYTYKANLQVIETASEMSGTLLNTQA
ncbi:MAG TPA: flagellar basal body rod protein [Aquabacterium sp.]|uniref:flagellar basal body rod protein n=1 Tax=Aquabacterium sp. TaxID=1872578 RepID=UPI002D8A5AFE|nr:flagellar basal body rod protein [Aquabacterium sp.]HET6788467.1 flagellar basal body rod protein [Aquabacterium sp.]HEX5371328.1 flagellar basal body rod protein [Aquabacterium sp.]